MKVAVLQFFSWPERRTSLSEVYARALSRIEHMDASGYDAVWLAEHHFSSFSVCPAIHMVGTLVAARTSRLRIGMGVSLAAFYHPLRLAEEVALLDVLSDGRVNWGAGRGFARVEFDAFGVPPQESQSRFREHVDVVLAAWTHERLTYEGEHFRCEDVEVLPKPLQQPHPPVWVAASSDGAIAWAAEQGFTIMMDPHSPHREIARKHFRYRELLAEAGHSAEGREIPMARLVAIADTSSQAEEVARAGARWLADSYVGPQHKPVLDITDSTFVAKESTGAIERYMDGVIIHGTAEEVTDQVLGLREEIGLHYLLCAPLSHRSFELLTDRVLPAVAS
ncbi:MAG TPA: LLM class flavin-dependent oxidoreductase [Solirubrobacteraceae bacterium]|nr:LLM class flavin-dependent oxidoreductase [Solirubrobacteraceae bacterium]